MLTILLYVVVVAVVAVVLYALAALFFGRGEQMEPLPEGTTATALPARGISGRDVRALRFSVTLRGYDAREVDWALDRLAAELDSLRLRLREAADAEPADAEPAEAEPAEADASEADAEPAEDAPR